MTGKKKDITYRELALVEMKKMEDSS